MARIGREMTIGWIIIPTLVKLKKVSLLICYFIRLKSNPNVHTYILTYFSFYCFVDWYKISIISSSSTTIGKIDTNTMDLAGTLPTQLGLLTQLTEFKVHKNSLTGNIYIRLVYIYVDTVCNIYVPHIIFFV